MVKWFLLGFLVASVLWLGLLYAQSAGMLEIFGADDEEEVVARADAGDAGVGAVEEPEKKKRRHKRRGKRGKGKAWPASPSYETGEGISGDDLGGPGSQELAMGEAGGQEQLSAAEIDRGIDTVFNGIERCLVLVPSGAPATGKVVLGMHIAASGRVTKVNLKGPKPIVQGESGGCIRRAVKSIRYPAFDGPDMVAHYPIVFE
jgi:hypothetical protein